MMSEKIFSQLKIWSLKRRKEFLNTVAVSLGESKVLIDPAAADANALRELEAYGPFKAIYLSSARHEEAARNLKKKLKVPILIHEQEVLLMREKPDALFRDTNDLLCGLKVIHLQEQVSPGECLFYLPDQKTLLGSALIICEGRLSMHPEKKYANDRRAQAALRRLFSLDFETFIGDRGEPIFENAYRKLEEMFERLK